ncbi:MAG: fatty acid desaturase [Steroidobacteraceae bacterium]
MPPRPQAAVAQQQQTLDFDAVNESEASIAGESLDMKHVIEIVGDLLERSPGIYWLDLLLSAGAAWGLTAVYFAAPAWSALQIGAFIGASILFFRAGTFIHEIIHFPRREMVWFRRVWNLIIGVPLLMPWIFYRNHLDHHSARFFGTPEDGEYLPLAAAPVREFVKYLLQAPLLPIMSAARFLLLTPLSWVHRGLREWVLTAATAGVSNPYYRKRFPAREEGHLKIVEALCFIYLATLAVLVATGIITGMQLFKGYLLLGGALTLNSVRNLAAHRYGNRGEPMSHIEQVSDSINITGQTWLTVMLFPVGLRYHALHHLVPSLPYHNLGKAHQRLLEKLPADSPYHAVNRASFFATAAGLWRAALKTTAKDSAIPVWRQQNLSS